MLKVGTVLKTLKAGPARASSLFVPGAGMESRVKRPVDVCSEQPTAVGPDSSRSYVTDEGGNMDRKDFQR